MRGLALTFIIEGRGFESRSWCFLGRFVTKAQTDVADPLRKSLSPELVSLAMGADGLIRDVSPSEQPNLGSVRCLAKLFCRTWFGKLWPNRTEPVTLFHSVVTKT